MKKVTAKSRRVTAKKASGEAPTAETVNLAALRQKITNLVAADALQMVEETIAQVHNGHYQALKYLFEMVGLYPALADSQEMPQPESLAKTLLQRLGVLQEQIPSKGDGDYRRTVARGTDAVE